jgi:hypothetical protein
LELQSTFLSSMLYCHAGEVSVTPNPFTGFKTCGKCGVGLSILRLGLPICFQGHLSYLVVVSSASFFHKGTQIGAAGCFLLFSVAFWFIWAF